MGHDGAYDEARDTEKVRIGIFIPRWQKVALERIAEHEGRNVSDLIRQQVSSYLESIRIPGKWTETKDSPPSDNG